MVGGFFGGICRLVCPPETEFGRNRHFCDGSLVSALFPRLIRVNSSFVSTPKSVVLTRSTDAL